MVLPLHESEPAAGDDELLELVRAIDARLENLSVRFGVIEELLERYSPMLALAEARMSGGRFAAMRRGVPRAQNANETTDR